MLDRREWMAQQLGHDLARLPLQHVVGDAPHIGVREVGLKTPRWVARCCCQNGQEFLEMELIVVGAPNHRDIGILPVGLLCAYSQRKPQVFPLLLLENPSKLFVGLDQSRSSTAPGQLGHRPG